MCKTPSESDISTISKPSTAAPPRATKKGGGMMFVLEFIRMFFSILLLISQVLGRIIWDRIVVICQKGFKGLKVPDGWQTIHLHEVDAMALQLGMSVTCVSFFRGKQEEGVAFLQQRFKDILHANPWLAGSLGTQSGKPVIFHPTASGLTDDLIHRVMHVHESSLPDVTAADAANNFATFQQAVKQCVLPDGLFTSNGPVGKYQFCQFHILPCGNKDDMLESGQQEFAMVLSIAHSVADSATFHAIRGMISSEAPVYSMQTERAKEYCDVVQTLMGWTLDQYMGIFFVFNILRTKFANGKSQAHAFLLDQQRVSSMKKAAILESEVTKIPVDTAATGEIDGAVAISVPQADNVPWVSANDVLVSSFAKASAVMGALRILLVPVEMRERFSDMMPVGPKTAGNYLAPAFYLDPPNFESAVAVRKVVNEMQARLKIMKGHMPVEDAKATETDASKKAPAIMAAEATPPFAPIGVSNPMPTLGTFHTERVGVLTNWAPFYTQLSLPGCNEVFTLPVHDMTQRSSLPLNNGAFVFKMTPELTGMIVMTPIGAKEDYLNHMPVKELSYQSVMHA